MPLSEKLRFAKRWLAEKRGRAVEPFRPNFTKCFEHASIHAGGRIVIEAVGGAFGLPTYYQVRGWLNFPPALRASLARAASRSSASLN